MTRVSESAADKRRHMMSQAARSMVLIVAALLSVPSPARGEDKAPPALSAVMDELRQGGYVIYFRHATTEAFDPSPEAIDPSRCETQRNLSAAGRAQAERMGQAIRAIGIPIGSVVAGPSCRTRDTAQLAFGRFVADRNLAFVIDTGAEETKRLAKRLRQMLATPPPKGTNSVLVSHSANLLEAAGVFAKPEGAAYVFKPLAEEGFELQARILPEDWSRLVRSP